MSERTTITNLPPEIVTNIYKNLDDPSSITALNSSSSQTNLIWKLNPTSISSAVIYNKISNFSTALELLYLQEMIRNVDFTSDHPPTDRLSEIQQEARDALSRDETGGYLGASLNNGEYSIILARNQVLISNAKKAEHIGRVCTSCVSRWATETGGRTDRRKLHEDFILAYYSIWILATLRAEEAMEARLKTITGTLVDHMAVVMMIMVVKLPENERSYLGVSDPGLRGGYHMCTFETSWEKALRKVSGAWSNVGSRMAIEMFYGP